MDIYNAFKVEDEGGKVSVYRKMQRGRRRVGQGDTFVTAKLVAFIDFAQAGEIPTFKEFISAQHAGALERAAA